jgi:hypothetical protein
VSYVTTLGLSNRRAYYSGEAFDRPSQVGLPVGLPEGFFSFGATEEGHAALEAGLAAQQAASTGAGLSTGNATELGQADLSGIPTNPGDYLRSVGAPTSPAEFFGFDQGGGGEP